MGSSSGLVAGLAACGLPYPKDIPDDIEIIYNVTPRPEGPFGAKGIGEIGLVPTAGAVASALAAFDGVRRTVVPMIDSPAARALSVGLDPDLDRSHWH